MPPKFKRFGFAVFATAVVAVGAAQAQEANSAQARLVRARALMAARALPAAASELERLKRESGDESLQLVARAMLVNAYLEAANYDRAKDLLDETFKRQQAIKNSVENVYVAVAGQVIKSAGGQLERYKKLGLNITDANLPNEVVTDLGRWQKLIELIVEQSKELSANEKQASAALAMMETAVGARGTMARDEYEAARWRSMIGDVREQMSSAQTKIIEVDPGVTTDALVAVAAVNQPSNAVVSSVKTAAAPTPQTSAVSPAANTTAPDNSSINNQAAVVNAAQTDDSGVAAVAPAPTTVAANTTQPATETAAKTENQTAAAQTSKPVNSPQVENKPADSNVERARVISPDIKPVNLNDPVQIGSLVEMATRKVSPSYPATAKSARISGVVKVEVVVDEEGAVAEVRQTSGPSLLRQAATDAAKRWKFRPVTRDGQPRKAAGFINFNFTL